MMRKIKLTRYEKDIEDRLLRGEYVDAPEEEQKEVEASIAAALAARKKDAVLNIRINSYDLKNLKEKAQKLGVKYQTFISEILHRAARA